MSARLPFDPDDHLLAAVAWSRLAEPADRAASTLVGALGPGPALTWLLEEAHDAHGDLRSAPRPPQEAAAADERARTASGRAASGPGASAAWARAAARWAPRLATLDPRRDLDALERLGGSLLLPGDPRWPEGLGDLDQPPFCLWVRGDPTLLTRQHVPQGPGRGLALALVGSRSATRYGEQVARDMGRRVAQAGALIVSGGAFGIDAAAHAGALRTGRTVSVCAGGVDRLYPAANSRLLEEVLSCGALVAEVPPGCQPARHRFLSRNRLIAAMTDGTVVVEAAWRSGALSTARHARDLGRALGAVPGPVVSRESVGCHRLLREGAVCVTDADDALELITPVGTLDPDAERSRASDRQAGGLLDGLEPVSATVLDAMPARGTAEVAGLARAAGLSEREVRGALGLLELSGRVRRDGERWRRRT